MTKRFIHIMCFMLIATFAFSQQRPHYSLYMYNDAIINPAVSGTQPYDMISLVYRNQWTGWEGAPRTQLVSYNRAQGDNMGLGATVFSDITGPESRTGMQLTYSYRVKVSESNKLSFGISGNMFQYAIDNDKIELYDPNALDPAHVEGIEKAFVSDATFGTYFYNKNYYVGVSVPYLLQSKVKLTSENDESKLVRHYFINSGYTYNLSESFTLEPSMLLKKAAATPMQYDINLKSTYNDYLWAGVSYRDKDALIFMLGVDYKNYSFGYGYDKTLSDISSHSSGSNEIFIGYKFGISKDTDGDGVPDKKDKCPDNFGLEKYNGCPDRDIDSDGVSDEQDNCPNTAGPIENFGCPIITSKQEAIIDTAFTNLEFVFGKAEITFSSYPHLERLGKMLDNNPDMQLRISGHTDNIGGHEVNIKLSKARSEAVKIFLVNRGIDPKRIKVVYFGKLQPIATNRTKEGRAKNRRVELDIFFK